MATAKIEYPYLPEGRTILYVPSVHPFMWHLKEFAREHSLDKTMPGAALLREGWVITGIVANGSKFHETNGCERVRRGCKSGEGYELCEGCHPKNHSEAKAITDALKSGFDTKGADLYLWGHWWCCEPCWDKMTAAGIRHVYLLERSEILFNKDCPGNIVGKQFA